MSQIPTLLLSSRYTEDSQRLWQAAIRRGWNVERIHGWRVPDHIASVQQPVVYLEALMAYPIAEQLGLTLLSTPDDWLPRLPAAHRLREVRLATAAQTREMAAPAFIKPPNDKSFAARIYAPGELPDMPDDTPVLIAEIVAWQKEFRCFILDRQVVAHSIYLREGALQAATGFATTDEEELALLAYVAHVLADPQVDLPRAAVLDVGVIAGRGWAVIEANAAWGAGLYGCDADHVLDVIRSAATSKKTFLPSH